MLPILPRAGIYLLLNHNCYSFLVQGGFLGLDILVDYIPVARFAYFRGDVGDPCGQRGNSWKNKRGTGLGEKLRSLRQIAVEKTPKWTKLL